MDFGALLIHGGRSPRSLPREVFSPGKMHEFARKCLMLVIELSKELQIITSIKMLKYF
jgi:hypothetical protein